jgi:hypothetical protein
MKVINFGSAEAGLTSAPAKEETTIQSLAQRIKDFKASRFDQVPSEKELTLKQLAEDVSHLLFLEEHPIAEETDPSLPGGFASNLLETAQKIRMSGSTQLFQEELSPEQRSEVLSFIPKGEVVHGS